MLLGKMPCAECGCLADDHRTHAELLMSDDPIEVFQIRSSDFNGPLNYCGDCAECSTPRGERNAHECTG